MLRNLISRRPLLWGAVIGSTLGPALTGLAWLLGESKIAFAILYLGLSFAVQNAGVDDPDFGSQIKWLTIGFSLAFYGAIGAAIGAAIAGSHFPASDPPPANGK